MPIDLVVKGDVVTSGDVVRDGFVAVSGGQIAAIGLEKEAPSAGQVLDARGKLILPGAIDAHVHSASVKDKPERLINTTRAAAAGGVTTVIDMPFDAAGPVINRSRLIEKISEANNEAVVDVALYGTIAKSGGTGEIKGLIEEGACAFKMSTYETDPYRFPRITDRELIKAFSELNKYGVVTSFHAENEELVRALVDELKSCGSGDPLDHCRSRPPVTETTAIAHLLELALACDAKVHIAHISIPRGFDLVQSYRNWGLDVTAETCIHYLVLAEEDMPRLKAFGKINPPLRPRTIVEELWQKLMNEEIDLVTSDHAPWPLENKTRPNIFDNGSGVPGVELLLSLLYSEGVAKRGMDITMAMQLVSEAPARRFGLYPKKGVIRVGADADIVVLDPQDKWRFSADKSYSSAKWSPYDGMELTGCVIATIVRGQVVYDGKEVVGKPGWGRFIGRVV